MKREKDYIVTIITKSNKQDVQVRAKNKKEAETMVDNVLLGCNYFGFTSKEQYLLRIKRKYWRNKTNAKWIKY